MNVRWLILFLLISCGQSPFEDELNPRETFEQQSLADCRTHSKSNFVDLSLSWSSGPNLYDESILIVIFSKNGRRFDPPGRFELRPWMVHEGMNHGTYPTKVERISEGVFEVHDIYFVMEGRWDLHFEFYAGEQLIEEYSCGLGLS